MLYYFDNTISFNFSHPNLYSRICIILFSFTRIDSSSSEEDAHAKKKKKVVQEKVNNATDPVADKDANNTNLPAKNKAATADNNDEL